MNFEQITNLRKKWIKLAKRKKNVHWIDLYAAQERYIKLLELQAKDYKRQLKRKLK